MRRAAIAATGKVQYMRAFINFGSPLSDQVEDKDDKEKASEAISCLQLKLFFAW